MDDAALLRLLRQDPDAGIRALTDQYSGLVFGVCRRVLQNAGPLHELEGCVADTFSEFYLSLDGFRSEKCSIKTYLCVIARNNAMDLLRRHRPILSLDDDTAFFPVAQEESMEDALAETQLRRAVLTAIQAMGEPDRSILLRKYYYCQSTKEIAKALGLSSANVDTRASRAVAKLKTRFGGA